MSSPITTSAGATVRVTVMRTVPEIRASEVIESLQNGVTRFKADDEGYGSIEEKYALSPAGVRRLFKNDTLKGLKTIMPEFTFVNDVEASSTPEDIEETPDEVHEAQVAHIDHERASSLFGQAESDLTEGLIDIVVGVPNDGVEDLFK